MSPPFSTFTFNRKCNYDHCTLHHFVCPEIEQTGTVKQIAKYVINTQEYRGAGSEIHSGMYSRLEIRLQRSSFLKHTTPEKDTMYCAEHKELAKSKVNNNN